jgi:hypothetical protein
VVSHAFAQRKDGAPGSFGAAQEGNVLIFLLSIPIISDSGTGFDTWSLQRLIFLLEGLFDPFDQRFWVEFTVNDFVWTVADF